MGQRNIIELNGKRYDAITGAVLGPALHPVVGVPAAPAKRTLDGMLHSPRNDLRSNKAVPAPVQPHAKPKSPLLEVKRTPGPGIKAHQQQKGKTLMRRVVKKPAAHHKSSAASRHGSGLAAASVTAIAKPLAKKFSVSHVDPARAARAVHVPRTQAVRHFQPVREQRQHASAFVPHSATRPAAFSPAPRAPQHLTRTARPSQPDMFEAAIAAATSHEQPAPHIARSRRAQAKLISILAAMAACFILAGFITYLNMPGIQMRFAAVKVGFNAQLPTYAPTGYALGAVENQDNKISVSFRSGDSGYIVSQQASDWNSQTLLENYVAVNSSSHQTVESQGRTIYLYNGNNAAWVDGGVRYEVAGNAPLSADDIIKIAASM